MAIKIPDIIGKNPKKTFDALKIDVTPTDNYDTAEYCIISEFPTNIEVFKKDPYTGNIGSQLSRILSIVEMPRYNIYHTYACKTPVPLQTVSSSLQRHPAKLYLPKGFRHIDWGQLQLNLLNDLKLFKGTIIYPMGEFPLLLLLDTPKINNITNYRGSVFSTNDFPHLKDVIPDKFICPTFSARSSTLGMKPINQYVIMNDVNKGIDLYKDPTLIIDKSIIHTNPTLPEILSFYNRVLNSSETAFDIEATPEFVTCFSLTCSPNEGMSIPLMNNAGNMWTPEEEVQIWKGLAEILVTTPLIAQNGMFDLMYILRTMNIISDNFIFDTMIAQHIAWTDLHKGLDFLTSIYTYHNYYKDEGKLSHLNVIKDWHSYWRYNAKDSIYTHEIKAKLEEELTLIEATDSMTYMMELHKPLMEMEWNGILTKQIAIGKEKNKYINMRKGLQKALNRLSGMTLNTASSKQMIAYFYGILQIKPYINRKTKNATCDVIALSRIARKKTKGSVEAKIILKMRKYDKLISTYFNVAVDDDNHLRCHHKITGTVSGRLATEGSWLGTGTNLQNQPILFKKHLVADPDYLLCEVDLAKAEAHCVAYLSQDINMMDAFESGIDSHTFNASKIFDIPINDVTKSQRTMGKKVVHASNYGMGPQTFSDNLVKDDTFMSQSECRTLLNSYHERFPGLHRWHAEIKDTVYRTRMLYNMYNRPKRFLGVINNHLLMSAYSYIPQSTVAELLNKGSINISNDPRLGQSQYDIDLLLTVHDSDLFQFHISKKADLLKILLIIQSHMTHTFYYKGRSFTIGLDAKIGFNWGYTMADIAVFDKEHIEDALHKIGA